MSAAASQNEDVPTRPRPTADLGQQQDIDGDDPGIVLDSEDEEFLIQALDESMDDFVCPIEGESFNGMLIRFFE